MGRACRRFFFFPEFLMVRFGGSILKLPFDIVNLLGTQPLQWKLCQSFRTSSKVLDVQFGVNQTSLKMVSFKTDFFFFLLFCFMFP